MVKEVGVQICLFCFGIAKCWPLPVEPNTGSTVLGHFTPPRHADAGRSLGHNSWTLMALAGTWLTPPSYGLSSSLRGYSFPFFTGPSAVSGSTFPKTIWVSIFSSSFYMFNVSSSLFRPYFLTWGNVKSPQNSSEEELWKSGEGPPPFLVAPLATLPQSDLPRRTEYQVQIIHDWGSKFNAFLANSPFSAQYDNPTVSTCGYVTVCPLMVGYPL